MAMQLEMKQTNTMSPQQIQSVKILSMGVQELSEYINTLVQENPVLDTSETATREETLVTAKKVEWLQSNEYRSFSGHSHTEDDFSVGLDALVHSEEDSLSRFILSQFIGTNLEPEIISALEFLVKRLNSNGFLEEDAYELAALAKLPLKTIDRALIELKAADPAGVGAMNISECLQLQLERRAGDHRLELSIIQNHLSHLAKGQYKFISKALGASESEVRSACELIRTLNPRPSCGFASSENLVYITPDIIVNSTPHGFDFELNTRILPRLTINSYYADLLVSTDDHEVRTYLSEKIQQAESVVRSIEQRQTTLLRLVEFIVHYQQTFFRFGPGNIYPLTMKNAADALDIHESTVSRTVKDKYIQCNWGVYPLSYFFSRALNQGSSSAESAKELLKRLIAEEDLPLSDQKLCDKMNLLGCPISRRTVAKYREELCIPNAGARKNTNKHTKN